jgi:NAD/NADP transhydrogenase alpha subunit
MKSIQTILVRKESRDGELRVSLVPDDVKALVSSERRIWVESDAGVGAGFEDADYRSAGATIIANALDKKILSDVTLVTRVKRANEVQEQLELQIFPPGIKIVGALDPWDKHGTHRADFQAKGIEAYSLDAISLPGDHPMNILSSMSQIAGRLALVDAMNHSGHESQKHLLVIGFGVAGRAAADAARAHGYSITVMARHQRQQAEVEAQGDRWVIMDPRLSLSQHQSFIAKHLKDASIVITSARAPDQKAPILITHAMMMALRHKPVLVDLALSEGGNIEGSEHDQSIVLSNGATIINQSGYPKQEPQLASVLWSQATRCFIETLAQESASSLCDSMRIS